MKKINSALRISVIDNCNFSCLYCPREENMENYCPKKIRSKKLNTEEMKSVIKKILDKYQFTKIVITGGEPLLCGDLEEILKTISEYDNEIELDTNGSLFYDNKWNRIKKYIDGVKVSLDSLNVKTFNYLTTYGNEQSFNNIIKLINSAKEENIPITINCVCTKVNYNEIEDIVEFCLKKGINASILDLYYTKETENFWKENYKKIDVLVNSFKDKYGNIQIDDSFGCEFKKIYFNNTKNYIRFKSSSSATMRDELCEKCSSYCQEGIFCLRLSRQGWITVCQSNEENGILLSQDSDISTLIGRLENAKPDEESFVKMLKRNQL